jgi:hypothetical protein
MDMVDMAVGMDIMDSTLAKDIMVVTVDTIGDEEML